LARQLYQQCHAQTEFIHQLLQCQTNAALQHSEYERQVKEQLQVHVDLGASQAVEIRTLKNKCAALTADVDRKASELSVLRAKLLKYSLEREAHSRSVLPGQLTFTEGTPQDKQLKAMKEQLARQTVQIQRLEAALQQSRMPVRTAVAPAVLATVAQPTSPPTLVLPQVAPAAPTKKLINFQSAVPQFNTVPKPPGHTAYSTPPDAIQPRAAELASPVPLPGAPPRVTAILPSMSAVPISTAVPLPTGPPARSLRPLPSETQDAPPVGAQRRRNSRDRMSAWSSNGPMITKHKA
jgi:hypothetical protein